MKRAIFALLLVTLLTGCESLKLRNLGKSGVTTAVVYAVAGPIPAVANAATAMAYDEIVPEQEELKDIETTQQAVAYTGVALIEWGAYVAIAFLIITNLLVPWFTARRGYRKAKEKYKQGG